MKNLFEYNRKALLSVVFLSVSQQKLSTAGLRLQRTSVNDSKQILLVLEKTKHMSIGGYKIRQQALPHFITFAVVEWVDVFTRRDYRDILINSLRFMQQTKRMVLYAWCLMSNHVHLVAKDENGSDWLRDFKKFTSKQLLAAIQANARESRREWMTEIFRKAGEENLRKKLTSSGGKITSQKNYIARNLRFKRLNIFIIIPW